MLFGSGLSLPSIVQGGAAAGGGRPAWLPAWADSGVSYVEGEAYFADTLITDLATIHGDGFDPAAVTGAGMAVTAANENFPTAAGAFFDRMETLDFTFMAHFDTTGASPVNAVGVIMLALDGEGTGGGLAVEWGGGVGNMSVTDFNNGEFATIGTIAINQQYKVCGANTDDGWLSSLNGETAVLDTPQSVETITSCFIGVEGPVIPHNQLEGTIREIFFGPVTDVAADIEARASL